MEEGVTGAVGDGDLLRRYAVGDQESAERAFAALVDRHGQMVLRVCRNVLRDAHAAEDAFQATFLVLARKAGSLWVHDSIGPWLHGVAFRTSCSARNAAVRLRRHEREASQADPRAEADEADDLGPILHQEIGRLPERYRAAVVLCYLEGLTHDQAAERLGCPVGTVRSRLATGRDRLRRRLILRGMSPAEGDLEPSADRAESAPAVPAALAASAVRNALVDAATAAAGGVPAAVVALAEEGVRMMLLARFRPLALGLLLVGGSAAGVLAFAPRPQQPAGANPTKAPGVNRAPAAGAGGPEMKELMKKRDYTVNRAPAAGAGLRFLEDRIKAARAIIEVDLELIQNPPQGRTLGEVLNEIPVWSRHLMEDRLRLAATPAERLDAIREHRNLMVVFEIVMESSAEAGRGPSSAALKGKYYRLEADQLITEAGGDPAKEPPADEIAKLLLPQLAPAPAPRPAAPR
jgi:RNA polymerase sigma factor (sigma-70 family)